MVRVLISVIEWSLRYERGLVLFDFLSRETLDELFVKQA